MPKRSHIFTLGREYLLPFLIFINMLPPLSTTLYLPALPAMVQSWNTTNELASYTITIYMLVLSISMVFWGPLSDRYGRKPVLVWGGVFFFISSIGLVLSGNVWLAIFWRSLQGAGAGATNTVSLAIVKDILRGSGMEKVVSILQAGSVLAPLLAPIAGAVILYFISWHGVFILLAICAAIMLSGIIFLRETATLNNKITLSGNFVRIFYVLKQPSFSLPLAIFSIMAMAFMSFMNVSAYIFQDMFHLSPQTYSLFYSLISLMGLLGPALHIIWFRKLDRTYLITVHIIVQLIFCILIISFGTYSPWFFTLCFLPVSFFGGALRPPSTVLMMEQIQGDNGIVASLITCCALFMGSISMILVTLSCWANPIQAVGWIGSLSTAVCLSGWLFFIYMEKNNKFSNKS